MSSFVCSQLKEERGESKYFFEKEMLVSSEHHGLRLPGSPPKYLSISNDLNDVLVLTNNVSECVRVKVELKVLVNLCYYLFIFFKWCFYLEIWTRSAMKLRFPLLFQPLQTKQTTHLNIQLETREEYTWTHLKAQKHCTCIHTQYIHIGKDIKAVFSQKPAVITAWLSLRGK